MKRNKAEQKRLENKCKITCKIEKRERDSEREREIEGRGEIDTKLRTS